MGTTLHGEENVNQYFVTPPAHPPRTGRRSPGTASRGSPATARRARFDGSGALPSDGEFDGPGEWIPRGRGQLGWASEGLLQWRGARLERMPVTDDLAAYRAAAVLYAAGDAVGAARELEPLVADDAAPKSVLELAGRAYFRSAQLRRAESAFERLVERDPTDAYARFALGRTLERQSRRDEAAACYRIAAAMDPKDDYAEALDRVSKAR